MRAVPPTRRAWSALVAGLLCASLVVSAGFDPEVEKLARAHFATGAAYYTDRRWDDALREFTEAYRIAPLPPFLFNIGLCQEKLERLTDAIASYRRYLADAHADTDHRAEVEERIQRLEQVSRARAVLDEEAARRASARRPVYRRGWFWGVVVSSAVVVGGAVALGVVLGTREQVPTLAPATVLP